MTKLNLMKNIYHIPTLRKVYFSESNITYRPPLQIFFFITAVLVYFMPVYIFIVLFFFIKFINRRYGPTG